MRLDILTLFPSMFSGYLSESILKKAIGKKIIEIHIHDIRSFARDKHHITDDTPYGGGPGMVLKAEPIVEGVRHIMSNVLARPAGGQGPMSKIIIMSPSGDKFEQQMAVKLSREEHITIICGRYEGIDERVKEILEATEISIGDYVLTGGELAAMVLIDSISRNIAGVVGEQKSVEEDSFSKGILDWPHYTRPEVFEGHSVPKVLLSGNHEEIRNWRLQKAREKTLKNRPDLLKK